MNESNVKQKVVEKHYHFWPDWPAFAWISLAVITLGLFWNQSGCSS